MDTYICMAEYFYCAPETYRNIVHQLHSNIKLEVKKDEINWERVVVFTWQKTFCFPDNFFLIVV